MVNSYLDIDEERRKRDQLLLNKIGQFGTSLVQTPLSYESLLQDQDNRRRKIEADKQKLLIEKEAHAREQDESAFEMETKEEDAKQKKLKGATSNFVGSRLDKTDEEIKAEAFGDIENPHLPDDQKLELAKRQDLLGNTLKDERQKQAEFGLKERGVAVKEKDSDTKRLAAERRGKAAVSKVKKRLPPYISNAGIEKLAGLESKIESLGQISKYREQMDVNTGPLAGLLLKIKQLSHTQTPDEAILNSEVKTMLSQTMHELSGATVTPQEYERLIQLLPSQYDDEDVYEALTQLAIEMSEREYDNLVNMYSRAGYETGHIPTKRVNKAPSGNNPVAGVDIPSLVKEALGQGITDKAEIKAYVKSKMKAK